MTKNTETKSILEQFTVLERAVLYARVSGDDTKRDGRNIESQLDMGREYATERGYSVIAELPEDEKRQTSGHEIDLPQLNKIRDMAQAGQIDVLIVRELDRLSRNLAKQLIVEEELKRHGVRVEYVLAEYDDTPEGRLQKHIRATIAEYEREKTKERMMRGKRNKAKSGKVIKSTKRPYGYDFSEDDNFSIVESESRIIKGIFEWCLSGMGTMEMAQTLESLNIPTPYNAKQWHNSTVLYILKNKAYTGAWEFGKATRQNGHWKQNPQDYRIKIEIPPIIDLATFENVQAKLASNKKSSKRNTQREYLMARRMTCQCGASIVAIPVSKPGAKEFLYYRCRARYRAYQYGHTCELPTFQVSEVDSLAWQELAEYIHDRNKLEKGLRGYQAEMDTISQPLQDRLMVIDDTLNHWRGEWTNAVANMRAVKSDKAKALFSEELDRIESTIAGLEVEKLATVGKLEKKSLSEQQIKTALDLAAKMAEDWDVISQDFPSQRAFIELLDVQITLMLVDGKRKGLLTAKLPGMPKELCFDGSITHYTGYKSQQQEIVINIILDFD